MFDLKKPCSSCPFLRVNGPNFALRTGRLREIADADAFQCHMTLYSRPQQCAGLISVLAKSMQANKITVMAQALTNYDPGSVDGSETYDSIDETMAEHNRPYNLGKK